MISIEQLAAELVQLAGNENVKTHEPMSFHTSFRIGGPADIFITPETPEAVRAVVNACRSADVPIYIMGNGSNLLVRDGGIRGVVVNLFEKFNHWTAQPDGILEAEAGVLLSRLAKAAHSLCLGGMEFAAGIPGTVGGAVAMNAGAYDGEMKDIVVRTEYLTLEGTIETLDFAEHGFAYRTSVFQTNSGIVLRTAFQLKPCPAVDIKSKMDDFAARRREKQPLEYPSAGSVFRRPRGHFAGQLIEDCGLKGHKIGGAAISEKHAGFIVNLGGATAQNVIDLIDYVSDCVYHKFGVQLETEVKVIGEGSATE